LPGRGSCAGCWGLAAIIGLRVWQQTAETAPSSTFNATLAVALAIGFGMCLVLVAVAASTVGLIRAKRAQARADAFESTVRLRGLDDPMARQLQADLVRLMAGAPADG